MTGIRLALRVIAGAYAVLGFLVALFAMTAGRHRVDIGAAYLAVVILGWGGTVAAAGLFAGSVLGTLALVRHSEARRALHVFVIVSGWVGALVLGWIAWEFWTHSSLPRIAA